MPEHTSEQSPDTAQGASVNFSSPLLLTENAMTTSSSAGASNPGGASSSIDLSVPTAPAETKSTSTEYPTTPTQAPTEAATQSPTQTPTQVPTQAPMETPTTAPVVVPAATPVEALPAATATGNFGVSQSDESSAAFQGGARQSPVATVEPAKEIAGSASSLDSTRSSTSDREGATSTSYSRESITANKNTGSDENEIIIAHPGSDSSTFQYVASTECSKDEVDNVYTLYSNCRTAFDLCVYASNYQIFPYQGKHPTQAQIQGMAESDACIAMFVVVIKANFSACTIGGMPLVSAVETLLKISVDLAKGFEDKAPSADLFRELLTWRYEVDLAKAAGVPYDGNSALYAEFEVNLDAALENTTIRVNDGLSVDVRLPNGSYEKFEDAIDFIVKDASSDWVPGFVEANSAVGSLSSSSGSSATSKGVVIESSKSAAARRCALSIWSLLVVIAVSAFVAAEGAARRV
ncbi:unnamed protein product [Phytophthora fragariaefolia]|uniref:Unnamed protein product n=1 Tax=Phytophthora fragariaefolia TaxID=1490495 RepID=A0A9W6XCL8_9STRA|nr:unnamed protein product [Phytophthora fragariaefolia]